MEKLLETPSHDMYGPSLLPWLQPPEGGLGLVLSLPGDDFSDFAFSPLIRRVPAAFGLPDQPFVRVELLVQPDDHPEQPTLTNAAIDSLWQQALDQCHARQTAGLPAAPLCQKDTQGRWQPFRSVWHCRHINRFAHALCPDCGCGLSLCRDDAMLARTGLAEYSRSSQRYLLCPACCAAGKPPRYYTAIPPAPPREDVFGKDDLMLACSRLLERGDLSAQLPCVACSESGQCFGPSQKVLERMQALCFFPFHMIVQSFQAFDAVAFLTLAAAAQAPGPASEGIHSSIPAVSAMPISEPASAPADTSADRQISAIVAELLQAWPEDPPAVADITPPPANNEGDITETIILGPRTTPSESPIEKTVARPGGQPSGQSGMGDLDATVLLNPAPQPPDPPPPPTGADLDETVVLNPASRASVQADLDATVMFPKPSGRAPDDELEETVVISPAKPGSGVTAKGGGMEKNEDTDLEATVVLDPAKRIPTPRKP